jgi:hypothetical protein
VSGSVGRYAWGTFQEEVGRDLVAPGPPPLGGWPFAPWPLDTWCLGFSACLALLRRVVVVVWRPDSRSSPSSRPACQGRHIAALRRLMAFVSLPTAFGPWSCRVWAVFARRPHYG